MRLRDSDVDVMVARDELEMAVRAVALLEAAHAERLADVEALDGTFTAAWTRLTGTREARIEQAVAAVTHAEVQLRAAKAHLERVRAAAGSLDEQVERSRAEEEGLRAARVRRLDALEAGGGEVGAQVTALRLERALLQERSEVVDEAAFAGSDLLAALNTVVGANRRVERLSASRAHAFGHSKAADYGLAREGIDVVPARSERFRSAMGALGRVYTPDTTSSTSTLSPLVSLLVNDAFAEAVFANNAAAQADEYAELAGRVREQMIPIDHERRDRRSRRTPGGRSRGPGP
jgi:hypothetical protein